MIEQNTKRGSHCLTLVGAIIRQAIEDYKIGQRALKRKRKLRRDILNYYEDAEDFLFNKRTRRLEAFTRAFGVDKIIDPELVRQEALQPHKLGRSNKRVKL